MTLNIYQKMLAATSDIQTVAKNLNVEITKGKAYKAVGELDILNAVKPVEEKHGIYSYPYSRKIVETQVLERETNYGVRKELFMRIETVYRFVNIENPDEYIDVTSYADGIDSGDKATGKAMTYCDKYALMKAYKISTGEDPDQEASGELKKTSKMSDRQKAFIDKLPKTWKDGIMQEYGTLDLTSEQAHEVIEKYVKAKEQATQRNAIKYGESMNQ